MRVAVLMGGYSPEREVSLASGRAVAKALEQKGHKVLRIDPALGPEAEAQQVLSPVAIGQEPPSLEELGPDAERQIVRTLERLPELGVEVVFVALHGGAGEDGRVQAVLEMIGLPYTGSGPLASALAMRKSFAKALFRQQGVVTPDWLVLPRAAGVEAERAVQQALGAFALPFVVKPDNQGSTVGFSLVEHAD
ncbi:MAG: D-alanine--D-alanine ligase, partial [candidate division KSB1 bacterium]|nr:D-alanine--D-alanine ligase [candidate division KSB1 bacterium]